MSDLGLPDFLGKPLAVALIDLLLAGDNAVVIALVCLTLPARRLRPVLLFGTLGAIVARVVMVGVAGQLLSVPGLKLVGGVLLVLLAVNLARPDPRKTAAPPLLNENTGILATAILIGLIDVLMSLDNVLALAAVAGDSLLYLSLGLAASIAILMFGSLFVGRLFQLYPELVRLGTALLGWVAGGMFVSDSTLAGWITVQAPALTLLIPALAALYVYLLAGDVAIAAPTPLPAPVSLPVPTPPKRAVRETPRPPRTAVPAPAPLVSTVVDDEDAPASNRHELLLLIMLFAFGGLLLLAIGLLDSSV